MKCSNKPIHLDGVLLAELLTETAAKDDTADSRLWRACQQLLDFNFARRLTMRDLVSLLGSSELPSNGTTTLKAHGGLSWMQVCQDFYNNTIEDKPTVVEAAR